MQSTPSPPSGIPLDYFGHNGNSATFTSNGNLQIFDDSEYPGQSLPGYKERPLSQQLELIAVVGMGKLAMNCLPVHSHLIFPFRLSSARRRQLAE